MRKFWKKNSRLIVILLIVAIAVLLSIPKVREFLGCAPLPQQQNVTDLPLVTDEPAPPPASDEITTQPPTNDNNPTGPPTGTEEDLHSDVEGLEDIPVSDGVTPWVEINNNVPFFSSSDKSRTDPFEEYSDLDNLKRCGVAYANICKELMPTEKRGSISSVKPSGWVQASYPGYVDGNNLYNRCHLIGFQLAGENANKKNLITGTRYLNVTGMLIFENQVADYVKETKNHVLYRVTPVFAGDELVARGVLIEAYSVEDNGELQFCVYCFNIQPGIEIDYATGRSKMAEE